jgi:hypothetical protein
VKGIKIKPSSILYVPDVESIATVPEPPDPGTIDGQDRDRGRLGSDRSAPTIMSITTIFFLSGEISRVSRGFPGEEEDSQD